MDLLPDTSYCALRMRRECREYFPRHQLQRKPRVSDPDMHHGTCVTHVPWCMSGSLTRGGGENVLGIPGACATRSFTYLARGPWTVTTRMKQQLRPMDPVIQTFIGRRNVCQTEVVGRESCDLIMHFNAINKADSRGVYCMSWNSYLYTRSNFLHIENQKLKQWIIRVMRLKYSVRHRSITFLMMLLSC